MAVPKRKKSKMRVRQRRAHIKAVVPELGVCPTCGAPVQSHHACSGCGMYKGRKVLSVEA